MTPLFDPQEMADPLPFYAWARVRRPVFYDEASGLHVLTRHADVLAVIADEKRFSAEADRASYAGLCPEAVAILRPYDFDRLYGLSTTENPDHDRLKKVALPLFNDQFFKRLKPQLQELVDRRLDALEPNRDVDLVASLFRDLPAELIFVILGVPPADVPQVKLWSASRLALTWGEAADQVEHARNVIRYWEYSRELMRQKMAVPAEDLPSALGEAVRAGALPLHQAELFCYGLVFSGHATTSAFLAESLRTLLATGAWGDLAAAGRPCGPTADELLRLCPSAFTRRRLALEDAVVRGHAIPKGARSCSPSGRPTATRRCSPTPTGWTPTAATPTSTSRSASASTTASGPRS